jgi:AcrR family transcriptional regulator
LSGKADPRVKRTRKALIDAFDRLVLGRHARDIRAADVIAEAKVGRSTFYDHYSSAEELHLEALKRPLAPLAAAAAGQGEEQAVAFVVQHFWDYRERARRSLNERAERLLAEMVEDLLAGQELLIPARLAARQLAGSAFAPLRAWLHGEASSSAGALAASICRAGRAQREALTPDHPVCG